MAWSQSYWNLFPRVPLTTCIIGSDNGLPPNRRQAVIWSNDGRVYWCIYTSLSLANLNISVSQLLLHHIGNSHVHLGCFIIGHKDCWHRLGDILTYMYPWKLCFLKSYSANSLGPLHNGLHFTRDFSSAFFKRNDLLLQMWLDVCFSRSCWWQCWFRQWPGAEQTTSYYLVQWWTTSLI